MKKAIALLVALMMCISILAACGGGDPEPEPAPKDPGSEATKEPEKSPEPSKSPEPVKSPEPDPEPVDDGRITISHEIFGDISFIVPADGNYELLLAEPGQDSLELFDNDIRGQSLTAPYSKMTYQKAFISGDGFDILIGYKDLLGDTRNDRPTYDMTVNDWTERVEVNSGGLIGYSNMWFFYILAFPATTQYGMRLAYVIPHVPDGGEKFDRGKMRDFALKVMDTPEPFLILDSLEFSGEKFNETRYETEPFEGKIITVAPKDGWEFNETGFLLNSFNLIKEGIGNTTAAKPFGEITIFTETAGKPLKEIIEDRKGSSTHAGLEQIDNITINGQEYLLFYSTERSKFMMFTSPESGVLDLNMVGYIQIEVKWIDDINLALPMLESITFNP